MLQICYPPFKDRSEYWNPKTLTYRFIAEAKRLWELEAHHPRLTTIQAGMIFSVFHNLCGLDEIGQPYRLHALALAKSMSLFDRTEGKSSRIRHGMAYTAWALFNWETYVLAAYLFGSH